MIKQNSGKNKQIVILTIFAMTLVVIGHCDITSDFKELWIYKWVYSFHMPLFFFISGFLFLYTFSKERFINTTYFKFIKNKAKRLLIPFLFINSIIFFIKSLLVNDSSLMQNPITFSLESFITSTLFRPIGFMWFLPTLFVIFSIMFIIFKELKIRSFVSERTYLGLITLLLIILSIIDLFLPSISFMQFSKAIHFMFYFVLGTLYCDYKPKVDFYIKKYWILILPVSMISSIFLFSLNNLFGALSGIIMSISISLLMENKCPHSFIKISEFCYLVFLLSYFPQMFIRGPIANRFEVNQYVLSSISLLFGLTIPLLVGVLYQKYKKRSQFLNKTGILIGF